MPLSEDDRARVMAALSLNDSDMIRRVNQQSDFLGWLRGKGAAAEAINSWLADVARNMIASGAGGAAVGLLASRNSNPQQKVLAAAVGAALASAIQDVTKRIVDEGRGRPTEAKARAMLEERLTRDERVIAALQAQNRRG